jgi:hypothetical protein
MSNLPYTTLAEVKQQLNVGQHGTLNVLDDDLLTTYVYQASAAIDAYCGRSFADVTNGTGTLVKKYDYAQPPIFGRKLFVDDDLLSVTALYNDGNTNSGTIGADKYRLLPPNDTPKYAIELTHGSGYTWGYDDTPEEAIRVQGSWGYATSTLTMPAEIRTAATKLAAFLYQTRDNDGSRIQFADGSASIPPGAPPMVFKLLDTYVKVTVTS